MDSKKNSSDYRIGYSRAIDSVPFRNYDKLNLFFAQNSRRKQQPPVATDYLRPHQ